MIRMRPAPFKSLSDFLLGSPADVDGLVDDGWGAPFPVKGREIDAVILFADIAGFSRRTLSMSAVETLAYVNNFFAWISAEALHERPGIVDKYIGDEIMVVYAKEFGSDDPLGDAIGAAQAMLSNDYLAYAPHIGIASGSVVVGYVGTSLQYSASVFGAPVALAARCAAVGRPADSESVACWITLPARELVGRDPAAFLPVDTYDRPGGGVERVSRWELTNERAVAMKNLGEVPVQQIVDTRFHKPSQTAEERARDNVQFLLDANRYWPRR